MNLRELSNVHFMRGKSPVVRVQCHRQPTQARDLSKTSSSSSSLTNEFLKKGGSLPSVFPDGDFSKSSVEPQSQNHLDRVKLNIGSRNKCCVTLNRKRTEALNKQHSVMELVGHHDTSQLEEQIEHLSSKLSKVHDILQNHVTDATKETQDYCQDSNRSEQFSASDYTFILLEMNGTIQAQPYNPNDFSEKDIRQLVWTYYNELLLLN